MKKTRGRNKLPTLRHKDKQYLRKILPTKSPAQMRIKDGRNLPGEWSAKDVQSLLVKQFDRKVAMANCLAFIRELGLVPIIHYPGDKHSNPHLDWEQSLSPEFLAWKEQPATRKTIRKESARLKKRPQTLIGSAGPPRILDRPWKAARKLYHLDHPDIKNPNSIADHLMRISADHQL